jgi:hypothetical protein
MATLRQIIVDTDSSYSGYDYSTLATAESTEQGNISNATGTDEYVVFECYATSGTSDGNVVFDGWTTELSGGNYVEVTGKEDTAEYHDGIWDDTKYRIIATTSACISNLGCGQFRVTGLQLYQNLSSANRNPIDDDENTETGGLKIFSHNIIKSNNHATYVVRGIDTTVVSGGNCKIFNNIMYDLGAVAASVGVYINVSGSNCYVYNNTISKGQYGVNRNAGTAHVKNNIFQDQNTRAQESAGSIGTNWGYNIIEDGTITANSLSGTGTDLTTGTATSYGANKLNDSGGGLSVAVVGSVVANTTDSTYTYVTVVDSDTQLTLSADIFDTGNEAYRVTSNIYGNPDYDTNFHLNPEDTLAMFHGTNLYADANSPVTDDILGNSRGASTTDNFDIGAHHSLEYNRVVDPDSGTGYDYTSINTFESNEQADLRVSGLGKIATATCRSTGGTADSTAVLFDGWETDTIGYIKLWTDPTESYRHDGSWVTGNKYRHVISAASTTHNIRPGEQYVHIDGLQIENSSTGGSGLGIRFDTDFASGWIKISDCIMRGTGHAGTAIAGIDIRMADRASSPGFTAYIWNNIIYDWDGSGSRGIIVSDAMYAFIYNNTVYNCDTGIEQRDNFYAISMVCKNNITNSCTSMDYEWDGGTIDATSTHNVGDNLNDGESDFGATWTTGTTTSASTGKLIDTGKNFNSIGVRVNSIVRDSGTGIAYVTAIDSDTQLSVSSDIFGSSEAYKIYKNTYGSVTFTNEGGDIFTLGSTDTAAIDMGDDLSSDSNLPITDDILGYIRPYNSVWDVGAHEYEAGETINFAGTISPVTLISAPNIYRIMDLTDTISAVFNTAGVTLYRIMDLTGTVDTVSSLTCSEITIIYVLNPTSGGLAWGEETPTESEIAAPWSVWSDGAGGTPTITGDQDWGILSIDTADEGRSNVYDFGDSVSRTYTLTLNRYGSGTGTPVVQIRGQNTSFLQDDVSPSWETYSTPVAKTWRYVQVRIDYS